MKGAKHAERFRMNRIGENLQRQCESLGHSACIVYIMHSERPVAAGAHATAILSGLPIQTEAPVMTPDGKDFLFLFYYYCYHCLGTEALPEAMSATAVCGGVDPF